METGLMGSKFISTLKYGGLMLILLVSRNAHAEYYVVYGAPQTIVVPAPTPCCRVIKPTCAVYHRPKRHCGYKVHKRKYACYNPCKRPSCGSLSVYYTVPSCGNSCDSNRMAEERYTWVSGEPAVQATGYYEMSGEPIYTNYTNTYHHVYYDDRNWDMRTSDDIYY